MSIKSLEDVATPIIQERNGNVPDVDTLNKLLASKWQPPIIQVIEEQEVDWDEVITLELLNYQIAQFWLMCEKQCIPTDGIIIKSLEVVNIEKDFVTDQGDENYRDEKNLHTKLLTLAIDRDGFKTKFIFPILATVRDDLPKDRNAKIKKRVATGKHRTRSLFYDFKLKQWIALIIEVPNEIILTRIKTLENDDDEPRLGNDTEDIEQAMIGNLKKGCFDLQGKNHLKKIDDESRFLGRNLTPAKADIIVKNVRKWVKQYKADKEAAVNIRWVNYDTTPRKGRRTYDELAKGQAISTLFSPIGGDKHFSSVDHDDLVEETGEKTIGKISGGDRQDIDDAYKYASRWWGKKFTYAKERNGKLVTDTGMSFEEAWETEQPFRIYTCNVIRGSFAEAKKLRHQTEKLADSEYLIAQGYAAKILKDNAEYYLEEMKKGTSFDDIISGIKLPFEHTAHLPQSIEADPNKKGKRKENTYVKIGTHTPCDHLGKDVIDE